MLFAVVIAAFVALICIGMGKAIGSPEIDPSTYQSLYEQVNDDPGHHALLRRFMADGKITYDELRQWNEYNLKKITAYKKALAR